MARITELRVKGEDGAFTEVYSIGANASNVILSNGTDVETALDNLEGDLDTQISNLTNEKANTFHASSATTYGVGTESLYGHLKISDTYNEEGADPNSTALSQAGIYALYKMIGFQVLDDEKLYSALNTAYHDIETRGNTLTLVSDFYEIDDEGTTLTIVF